MFKDLLLTVLVSVVWRSASATYVIDGDQDFNLFSGTRLGTAHFSSPDVGSSLHQSDISGDDFGHGVHAHQPYSRLFHGHNIQGQQLFHHQDSGGQQLFHDQNTGGQHLFHDQNTGRQQLIHDHNTGGQQLFHDQNTGGQQLIHDQNTGGQQLFHDQNTGGQKLLHDQDSGGQEFSHDHDSRRQQQQHHRKKNQNVAVSHVNIPALQKQSGGQYIVQQESYEDKTEQHQSEEEDDQPRYINNGFRPVSDSKNFVVQQLNIGSDIEHRNNNNASNSGYQIFQAGLPVRVNSAYPLLYGLSHQGFPGHGLGNQYSIVPIAINNGHVPRVHGFNGIGLPVNPYGPIVLGHLNSRFIKLSGEVLSQPGGGVAHGLTNFFNRNQSPGQNGFGRNTGQVLIEPGSDHPLEYQTPSTEDETGDVEQSPVDVGLQSYDESDAGTDYPAKDSEDVEQKPVDVGVKTVKTVPSTKTASVPTSSPKSTKTSNPRPHQKEQTKSPDYEQKLIGDSKEGDNGRSKSSVQQRPVKVSIKTAVKDLDEYGSLEDTKVEYNGGDSSSDYSSQAKEDTALVTEQKIYKDVQNRIKTSLKDLAPSDIDSLFKSDDGYDGGDEDEVPRDIVYESKKENKPYSDEPESKSGSYGNSRPSLVRNSYNQNPKLGSPAPTKYPASSKTRPGGSGSRYFYTGSGGGTGAYAANQKPPGPKTGSGDEYQSKQGNSRRFQITPGDSGNGAPKPPVYTEERSKPEEYSTPKYRENTQRPKPQNRYPPFHSGRSESKKPAYEGSNYRGSAIPREHSQVDLSAGPKPSRPGYPPFPSDSRRSGTPSTYRAGGSPNFGGYSDYQRSSGSSGKPSSEAHSGGKPEEYPSTGEKYDPRSRERSKPSYSGSSYPQSRGQAKKPSFAEYSDGSSKEDYPSKDEKPAYPKPSGSRSSSQPKRGPAKTPSYAEYSDGSGKEEYPSKVGRPAHSKTSGSGSSYQQSGPPAKAPSYDEHPSSTDEDRHSSEKPSSSTKNQYSEKAPPSSQYPKPSPGSYSAGSRPYPGTEAAGGSRAATKTRPAVKTEQRYLPISSSLSGGKTNYDSAKKPDEIKQQQQQQEEEDDDEFDPDISGSSGHGLNSALPRGASDSEASAGHDDEDHPPMPYEFEFDVQDDEHGTQYRREKVDDSGRLTGRYGFQNPEGTFRQVEYEAGKDGFKVNVIRTNEPGTDGSVDPADVHYEVVL